MDARSLYEDARVRGQDTAPRFMLGNDGACRVDCDAPPGPIE